MRNGLKSRVYARPLVVLLVLCTWSATAAANNYTFSCSTGLSNKTLCIDSGKCTGGANNPQDVLNITGVSAGTIVDFIFSNTGTNPTADAEIKGQGQTADPSPTNISVPPDATSHATITATDAADGQADFKLQMKTQPTKDTFAQITYSVSCTPPPPAKGTIKFIKNTDSSANNGTFPISVGGGTPATVDVTTANGTGTVTQDYAPGTYTIGETPPSGWKLDSISCTGTAGSSGTTAVVVSGQTVTCTITNSKKKGTIKFIKNTDSSANNGTFPISVGGGTPATVDVTTANGTGTVTQDYAPGTYTIGETPPSGWKLDSISCTGTAGSSGTTAVVVSGQTVTCTITNSKKKGTIKFIKNTDSSANNGTFPISVGGGTPATVDVTTANGTGTVTQDYAPGTYTIGETPPSGWKLDSISCTGTAGSSGTTAVVVSDQTVTCTITNSKKKGTIKFIKNTDSSANNGTFPISVGGGTPATVDVTTANGTGTVSQDYAPGTYTIGETPPSGWKLDSISCTGTAGSSGTTAVVVLDETATCTINNTKKVASLKLEKSVDQTKYTDVGQTLTYKLVATNTGNVDLTDFAISDPTATVGACSPVALGGTLAAGASTTCTASYVTTQTDITNKCVTNTATASGQDGETTVTSAPASAKVCLTPDKTTETIHNFLERRVDLLASNEPDRARLMRRFDRPQQPVGSLKDEGGPMKLMGSSDANSTQLSFATSLSQLAQANAASAQSKAAGAGADPMRLGAMNSAPLYAPAIPFDVWIEGHFQKWDDDLAKADRSGNFGILYVGADYLVRPWLLVGALVQLDWMDDQSKLKNTEVSGNGWMAGPYVSMKLSDNIYFDARGAWGQSDNSVNPFGTYTDSFDTDRWLAKANLTGDWHFDRFRVSPSVGVIYVEETQHSYVDSLGFTIPEQSVHVGRLTFGPEFGYEILAHDGSIVEPHVSFTGIWDFDGGPNTIIDGLVTSQDDLRLKIEGGLLVHSAYGTAFRGTVSYDGIGTDNFSAWGGQLWVSLPLH